MSPVENPYTTLADEDELWPNTLKDRQSRVAALHLFAEGALAIEASGEEATAAFALRSWGGSSFWVAQRHVHWLDFLARRGGVSQGASQSDAQKILRAGRHLLLTGGPGTGKSYTIENFVQAHGNSNGAHTRIAIAAPTGKAAVRFKHLEASDQAIVECSTLHRLLGISNRTERLRYHATNPLPFDILIIDEISMLSLSLLRAAITSLSANAQLVLAGDLDQLPSIEGLPVDKAIEFLTKQKIISHVNLTEVQRFSREKAEAYRLVAMQGIEALSDARVSRLIDLVRIGQRSEFQAYIDAYIQKRVLAKEGTALRDEFKIRKKSDGIPEDLVARAFAYLRSQVVLCERREGPYGSVAVNAHIAAALARLLQTHDRSLEPIMNTRNDYDLQIFNGDVGFLWQCEGELYAVFDTYEGHFRVIPTRKLPGLESAFAMTIHKSQGSEYKNVFVVTEIGIAKDSRLVYTAVTRARENASVLLLG